MIHQSLFAFRHDLSALKCCFLKTPSSIHLQNWVCLWDMWHKLVKPNTCPSGPLQKYGLISCHNSLLHTFLYIWKANFFLEFCLGSVEQEARVMCHSQQLCVLYALTIYYITNLITKSNQRNYSVHQNCLQSGDRKRWSWSLRVSSGSLLSGTE